MRQGEGSRMSIMAGYVFAVIASYNMLKLMTRSLVVSNLGLRQLPILYLLLAVVVAVVVVFYMRISSNRRLDRLINGTNLFLMSNILVFRWLLSLDLDSGWLYYTLFPWVSIYGVLTTTQFWLLANYLFNAREAKRIFPLLTSSAILGGIASGYFTRFLVNQIGTVNLTLICTALLAATTFLMNLAWQRRETSLERSRRSPISTPTEPSFKIVGEVLALIRNSRHLALLMGIVFLTFLVVQIADFQFLAFGSEAHTRTDDLTGFLGFWLSTMSVIALLFQVFLAGFIIRRFGVGVTILFLPIALLLSSFGVLFAYGLVAILALKIGDGTFRHSINKVGSELLYLPIPPDVKRKTKAFVDMFADRFARGLAGLILLIFYSWLGLSVAQLSLISILAIIIWLGLAFATYREYVNSFRQAIAKRRIDADLLSVSISDEETMNSLIVSLGSRNDRQVVYALKLLESVRGVELVPPALPLLRHKSAEVRLHALRLICQQAESDMSLWPNIQPLLHDEDVEVRREAIRFYASFSKESVNETLADWLQDEDCALRGAALYYVAEKPKLAKKLLSWELIRSFIKDSREGRIQAASALGTLGDEKYHPFLMELLEDSDVSVKTEAIRSAGQTHNPQFVPLLIRNLANRNCRKAAREALAEFGDSITDILAAYLYDPKVSMKIRYGIPRVLGLIGSQHAIEVLLKNLDQKEEFLRYQVIKALNKVRARFPVLKFDQRVDHALNDELKKYFRILAALHVTESRNGQKSCFSLLKRTLQERLDDHIDRIFRLLGLSYPPRDIYNAYAATISANRSVRANAVEFLDNILASHLKRVLLPIVEELPVEQVLQKADGLLDVDYASQTDALEDLVKDSDPWIHACALFEIGQCGLVEEFRAHLDSAMQEENSLVQETAHLVMKKFQQV